MSRTVPGLGRPAVVDVEILVTSILQSQRYEEVCYFEGCIRGGVSASSIVLIELISKVETVKVLPGIITQLLYPSAGVRPNPFSSLSTKGPSWLVGAARPTLWMAETTTRGSAAFFMFRMNRSIRERKSVMVLYIYIYFHQHYYFRKYQLKLKHIDLAREKRIFYSF
jgi:hypothetical protein